MAWPTNGVKQAVLRRDKYRCRECGVAAAQQRGCRSHVHHVIREAGGGTHSMDNLASYHAKAKANA